MAHSGEGFIDDDHSGDADPKSVLARAVLILDAFEVDTPALSFSDFCRHTGLPRSTVHRMLDQLVSTGILERVGDRYQLGTRIFELGTFVRRYTRLREIALPFMYDLHEATHETVHLGVLSGHDVLYLEKITGHGTNAVPSDIGGRRPAHCTGLGKVLLAYAGDDVIEEVLANGLTAMTPSTIVDPNVFRDEMRTIRQLGVAFDREEVVPGLKCAAVPLRGSGRAIAALSITGPASRIKVDRLGPALKTAANGIWRVMFPHRE